jgi:hypothetical protein
VRAKSGSHTNGKIAASVVFPPIKAIVKGKTNRGGLNKHTRGHALAKLDSRGTRKLGI